MIELTLYSRRDCHLCQEMKERVEAETGGFPARLTVVDVDSRAELAAEYGDDVPVLLVAGRKFAKHRLERGRLREKLRREERRASAGEAPA